MVYDATGPDRCWLFVDGGAENGEDGQGEAEESVLGSHGEIIGIELVGLMNTGVVVLSVPGFNLVERMTEVGRW